MSYGFILIKLLVTFGGEVIMETERELFENNHSKQIRIKFWDNENYNYPIIIVNSDDFEKLKEILNEYQKNPEYNWDDFLEILKENKIRFDTVMEDEELFF